MRSAIIVLLLTVLGGRVPAGAQTPDDSVAAVVQQAIDGLSARDTVALRKAFAPSALLLLLSFEGDSTAFRTIPIRAIAASLGAPGAARREELRNPRIAIAGDLATLSAEYAFYFDGVLHHCGVAMYDLMRIEGQWRIVTVRETDRRVGCHP